MIIFLLIVIITILSALLASVVRKEFGAQIHILQEKRPAETISLFDPHGFEAAVKEERRQMAFDEFCLNYNKELDYFCSKPVGHDVSAYIKGDEERTKPRHGYAGVFWEARNG